MFGCGLTSSFTGGGDINQQINTHDVDLRVAVIISLYIPLHTYQSTSLGVTT